MTADGSTCDARLGKYQHGLEAGMCAADWGVLGDSCVRAALGPHPCFCEFTGPLRTPLPGCAKAVRCYTFHGCSLYYTLEIIGMVSRVAFVIACLRVCVSVRVRLS